MNETLYHPWIPNYDISCDLCFLQTTNYELRLQKSETEIKTLKEENRMLENKVVQVFECILYRKTTIFCHVLFIIE